MTDRTAELVLGQGFEHLYYLLEAAVAGLGVAIAPQLLVADDLAAGRLAAPWGFVETPARLALSLAGTDVPGTITFADNNTLAIFRASAALQEQSEYLLTMRSGITDRCSPEFTN